MFPTAAEVAATALLAAATVTDLSSRRIPNAFTYPAVLIAPLLAFMEDGTGGLASAGLALAVTTLPFVLLFAMFGGIGGGDVKLLAASALLLRFPVAFDVLFAGLVVAVGFLGLRYGLVTAGRWFGQFGVTAEGGRVVVAAPLPRVIAFAPCLALGFVWVRVGAWFGLSGASAFL